MEQATALRLAGQTRQAITAYRQRLDDPDPLIQLEAINGIALCLKMEKQYQKALMQFKQAVKLAQSIHFEQRLSGLYRDIATTYEYQQKYATADRWYEKAIANLEEYGDKPLSANPHWGITVGKRGLLMMRWGKLDLAERLLQQGLAACQKGKADFYILTLQMHLLELSNHRGKHEQTLAAIPNLVKEARAKKWDHRAAQLLIIQAIALEQTGHKSEAQRAWQEINQIEKQLDSPEMRGAVEQDIKRLRSIKN